MHGALIVGGITGLAVALRLANAGTRQLTGEEVAAIRHAESMYQIWAWPSPGSTASPPLYYTVLAVARSLGLGDGYLRACSSLASAAVVPLVYATARRLATRRAGYIAALVVAVSPFQVRYAQRIGPDALVALEAAVVFWALTWILRYQRTATRPLLHNPALGAWAAYVAGMGAALLSTSSAPVLWGVANVYFFASWRLGRRPQRELLWAMARANIAVMALWLLWLPASLTSLASMAPAARWASSGAAMPHEVADAALGAPTLGGALGTLRRHFPEHASSALIAVVGALLVCVIVVVPLGVRRRRLLALAASAASGALLAAAAAVTYAAPHEFASALLWTTILGSVLAGLLLAGRSSVMRLVAVAALLAAVAPGIVHDYEPDPVPPLRDIAAWLRPQLHPGDVIVCTNGDTRTVLDHYLAEPGRVSEVAVSADRGLTALRQQIPGGSRYWSVAAATDDDAAVRSVQRVLDERGTLVVHREWDATAPAMITMYVSTPASPGGPADA